MSQGTLDVEKLTGDDTGLLELEGHTTVNLAEHLPRTHLHAHMRMRKTSKVVLPAVVYIDTTMDVNGGLFAAQNIFVRGHLILQMTGYSIVNMTGTALSGEYYMTSLTVLDTGRVQTISYELNDLRKSVDLRVNVLELKHVSTLAVDGVLTVYANRVNIENASTVDGEYHGNARDGGGYKSAVGPGAGCTRNGGSGASYGGKGERSGYSSYYCNPGSLYGDPVTPLYQGSGGGNCNGDLAGGYGGAAVKFAVYMATIDGNILMDGQDGAPGAGGGSGGTIWIDSVYLEGRGRLSANGGNGVTKSFNSYTCYGGDGGGGRIRVYTESYLNFAVQLQHTINSPDGDGVGSWTVSPGKECNGIEHGSWNNVTDTCDCNPGYLGDDCQFKCEDTTTCHGHGTCNDLGQCLCNEGYVGYRCRAECDVNITCSGNGVCTPYGLCVCDPCYHGDDCSLMCGGGNGECIADKCVCDACHLGEFCESTCNERGTCVNPATNTSYCECGALWYGARCTEPGCPGVQYECTGHGVCNAADHVCYCDPGWAGESYCKLYF